METIAKCAGAAIIGSVLCLFIKKNNPELSLSLGLFISVSILISACSFLNTFGDLLKCAKTLLGDTSALVRPLLKCLVIGLVSRLGADICKDASQNTLASSLELAGTVCAAATAMPVIMSTLQMIGTIV